MKKISIVAPAYNEEKNIELFINKIVVTLKKNNLEGEILIIDDASTDKTGKMLDIFAKKIHLLRVIHNKKNLGITGASWKGFNEAKGDIIVFLPSDLESDPEEDIPKLLSALDSNTDLVVGWRYNKRQGFFKTSISILFNCISRILFGIKIHDLGWIKAFRKDIIRNIPNIRSDWHRFFVVLAAHEGYKIKEIKTKYHNRRAGKSKFGKIGLGRIPGAFFDIISIKLLLSFSKKPMFIFGSLGNLLFLIGFIGGIYLAYVKIMAGTIGNRLPMIFLVLLCIISGIQFFAIGFLAELIVDNKENKP